MSVISCKLLAEGATGSFSGFNQGQYTHQYLVETNDNSDEQQVVLSGCQVASPDPVPARFTPYAVRDGNDPGALRLDISCKRKSDDEGDRRFWIVTVNWGQPETPGTGPENPPSENPLMEPVRFHMEWLPNQTGISHDREFPKNPIVNSAGDFFEGVVVDDPFLVVVAVKNLSSDFYAITRHAALYQNTINDGDFWGYPRFTWKVESIQSSQLQQLNGIFYYQVTYRLANHPISWLLELVDRGSQAFDKPKEQGGKKVPVRVLDGPNKGDLLDMANLNPDGTQRPSDANPPGLFKEPAYRVHYTQDFNGLSLGKLPGQP